MTTIKPKPEAMANLLLLKEQLFRQEGFRPFVYTCPGGKLTIGVGRNVQDVGITEDEARYMLNNDVIRCGMEAKELVSNQAWNAMRQVRQCVLINMVFNLGKTGVFGFKNMLAALEEMRYREAATHMLDSKWARQVGPRAVELSNQMESGKWQDEASST